MILLKDNIYKTVPEEKISEYFTERKKILNFLKENKGKIFNAKQIAKKCGFPENDTFVEVRREITNLIELDGMPICGNVKGFFYAIHPNQIKFYSDSLQSRLSGLQRRIDCVNKIYNIYVNRNLDEVL